MAKGLQQQDFSNPQVWELIQNNKYEDALHNSQQQDLKPILVNWLNKNAPTVNVDNDQIVDLITNWYLYFKEISNNNKPEYDFTNPLFAYLRYLGKVGIKPEYNDLVAVNNKYEERILDDVDFKNNSRCKVLENPSFYGKDLANQNYWLDIYAFFTEPNNVKKALDGLEQDDMVEIGKDSYTKSDLENDTRLRDALLFSGANPKNKLRSPRDIEFALNRLAKNLPQDELRKKKAYKDIDKLRDFILKNKDSLEDETLMNDLRLFVNEG